MDYVAKNLTPTQYMDVSVFGNYEFFDVFVQAKFKDFICNASEDMFPTLIKIFYSNINHTNGTIYETRK